MPTVETSKVIPFSPGRSYRILRFAGQETIELLGPDPAIEKINLLLQLDQSKEAVDSYFQQRREFLGRVGYPGVDEQHTKPTYWDENYITINFYLWIAGEGRSGISNEYRTWNIKSGEEIDIWKWFRTNLVDHKLPGNLEKYLSRNIKGPSFSECDKEYRGKGSFTITLAKRGLHINEEEWGDGCEKAYFISYAKLLPFLSPAGKQAVSAIIGKR
jgi:hypothetical protein